MALRVPFVAYPHEEKRLNRLLIGQPCFAFIGAKADDVRQKKIPF